MHLKDFCLVFLIFLSFEALRLAFYSHLHKQVLHINLDRCVVAGTANDSNNLNDVLLPRGIASFTSNKTCGVFVKPCQGIPKIYVVTPTHKRLTQKAELTRMSYTLMLVPALHWIVVEDAENTSALVAGILERSRIPHTHLSQINPLPPAEKRASRGLFQRNAGLDWILNNTKPTDGGVVYFADDDNTYDLRLFEEMRYVKRVGVWPVALSGGRAVERPNVTDQGKVVGWLVNYKVYPPYFGIDMAGFAVSISSIREKNARFPVRYIAGMQESLLLQQLVSWDELEVKADNCTKVYVWHTQSKPPVIAGDVELEKRHLPRSDVGIEV